MIGSASFRVTAVAAAAFWGALLVYAESVRAAEDVLVVDIMGARLLAGIAGDDAPKVDIENPYFSGLAADRRAALRKGYSLAASRLNLPNARRNVLFIAPADASPTEHEQLLSLAFDDLDLSAIYIVRETEVNLYASGRTTGVVVLARARKPTVAAPLVEGMTLPGGVTRFVGTNARDIAAAVAKAVGVATAENRPKLLNNVVLAGPGIARASERNTALEQAVTAELARRLGGDTPLKIVAPPADTSPWTGASILGSLSTFEPMLVTRDIYRAEGTSVLQKRMFLF